MRDASRVCGIDIAGKDRSARGDLGGGAESGCLRARVRPGAALRVGAGRRAAAAASPPRRRELIIPSHYPPAFPPDHYLNRELACLECNAHVPEEAADR